MRIAAIISSALAALAAAGVAQRRWVGEPFVPLVSPLDSPACVRVVAGPDRVEAVAQRLSEFGGAVEVTALDGLLAAALRLRLAASGLGTVDERLFVFDARANLIAVETEDVVVCQLVPDVLAGRLDLEVARSLRELRAVFEDGREVLATSRARAESRSKADGTQLEPWLVLVSTSSGADLERLRQALTALCSRPSYAARLILATAQRDASLWSTHVVAEWVASVRAMRVPGREACRAAFEHAAATSDLSGCVGYAFRWIESCKRDAAALAGIVERLGRGDVRPGCIEPRLTAAGLAARLDPGNQALASVRFEILTHDLGDWVGATRAGRQLAATMRGDATALNTLAWRLLTEEPYRGHLRPLALEVARSMSETPEWRTYWRLDTLALAEFENGGLDAAVRLQREASELCDAGCKDRYLDKLRGYERALAASVDEFD